MQSNENKNKKLIEETKIPNRYKIMAKKTEMVRVFGRIGVVQETFKDGAEVLFATGYKGIYTWDKIHLCNNQEKAYESYNLQKDGQRRCNKKW